MPTLLQTLKEYSSEIRKGIYFFVTLVVLVSIFPGEPKFRYEYTRGRPWPHQDLIAPFDFAVLKPADEVTREKEEILKNKELYFTFDFQVGETKRKEFISDFNNAWIARYGYRTDQENLKLRTLNKGLEILEKIYSKGILQSVNELDNKPGDYRIMLVINNVAEPVRIGGFYTLQSAYDEMLRLLENSEYVDKQLLKGLLGQSITYNVIFDEKLTEMELQRRLNELSPTRGMVQEGERIISKGEIITPQKYQLLESWKEEYQKRRGFTSNKYLLLTGQFILVALSLLVLYLFLHTFRREVLKDNKKVLLILLVITLMVFITSLAIKAGQNYIFLVPLCIVPVIIRVFFDTRLALYIFLITIIQIGFLVPNSFEFLFMQLITGIITILSIASLHRRSQFLTTAFVIFLSYSLIYTGLKLIQIGSFHEIQPNQYALFGGSAFLVLLAYPVIYIFERVFGLVTDVTLLELSDTNSKLLRELSMKAPGTFQHSLQVANLAEECIRAIGGNALLTRTGALYHDIGKMHNPVYFVENQVGGRNPHDELSYAESAAIIIEHVTKGVEMARKARLPEQIIDFIRTHHGNRKVDYFYLMQKKEFPEDVIDEQQFTYPGPTPFSKETAVVMMADSVEAASRSLKTITQETIDNLVESIISKQVETQQFINANITLRDITTSKSILKRMLMNIYHVRIEYPEG